MDSLTLELFRRLQAGPYDESGFKHIQRLLGSQRRVLRSKQDIATLTEIAELLEAWAISAEDSQLGAAVLAEAAEIAERELRRPALANELRALPAAEGGDAQERPSGARPYAALGRCRMAAGHPSGAIEAFERALEIEAEPDFVKSLADLYAQRGAEGDREQAADLYCTLGELLGPPDGIAMLRAALVQNPAHEDARALLDRYTNPAIESNPSARAGAAATLPDAPPPLPSRNRAAELNQSSARPQTSVDRNRAAPADRISATPALATDRTSSPGTRLDRISTPPGLSAPAPGKPPAAERISSTRNLSAQRPSSPGAERISTPLGLSAQRPSSPGAARISTPPGLGAQRPSSPGAERISTPLGPSTQRPSSPGAERIGTPPGLGAQRPSSPGAERISTPPGLSAQRPSSPGHRPSLDRISTPPGLTAPQPSSPTTQPYAHQLSQPAGTGLAERQSKSGIDRLSSPGLIASAPTNEANFERKSSTHAIPEPRPSGGARAALERQSSTHVIPEPRPTGADPEATLERQSSALWAAGPANAAATPPPLTSASGRRGEGRSAKQHSTLSGGWNPPAAGPGHIRAAGSLRFSSSAGVAAAGVSPAAGAPPSLNSTGTRARSQLASAEALADLMPEPEGTGPSVLEIDVSPQAISGGPASSLSPVIRDDEPDAAEPPSSSTRNRLLGAGVALASACIVWLALVLAPRNADPTASSRAATSQGAPVSNVRSESAPLDRPATPAATDTMRSSAAEATSSANSGAASSTGTTAPSAPATKPADEAPSAKPDPATTKADEAANTKLEEETPPATPASLAKPGKDRKASAPEKPEKEGPHVQATLELAGLRGGKINEAQLAAAIDKTTPSFEECYETALKRRPRLKGRLGFGWTIRPNGKVANVRKLNGAIKDPLMVKCTVDAINAARFPKPRNKPAEIFLSLEYRLSGR